MVAAKPTFEPGSPKAESLAITGARAAYLSMASSPTGSPNTLISPTHPCSKRTRTAPCQYTTTDDVELPDSYLFSGVQSV
jgi:hypothetical protein